MKYIKKLVLLFLITVSVLVCGCEASINNTRCQEYIDTLAPKELALTSSLQ